MSGDANSPYEANQWHILRVGPGNKAAEVVLQMDQNVRPAQMVAHDCSCTQPGGYQPLRHLTALQHRLPCHTLQVTVLSSQMRPLQSLKQSKHADDVSPNDVVQLTTAVKRISNSGNGGVVPKRTSLRWSAGWCLALAVVPLCVFEICNFGPGDALKTQYPQAYTY